MAGGRLSTGINDCAALFVRPIELLNHLLGEVDRIFVVDHDLDGLLASFVDDD